MPRGDGSTEWGLEDAGLYGDTFLDPPPDITLEGEVGGVKEREERMKEREGGGEKRRVEEEGIRECGERERG